MSNAYQSNSCGTDKCVRLCQYKEVRINTKPAEGHVGGTSVPFILPRVISQFARNHCPTLTVELIMI